MAPFTRSRSRTARANALRKALLTASANSVRKNAAPTTTIITRSRTARINALRKALITAFADHVRKNATASTTGTNTTIAIIINKKKNTMRLLKTKARSAPVRSTKLKTTPQAAPVQPMHTEIVLRLGAILRMRRRRDSAVMME